MTNAARLPLANTTYIMSAKCVIVKHSLHFLDAGPMQSGAMEGYPLEQPTSAVHGALDRGEFGLDQDRAIRALGIQGRLYFGTFIIAA